MMSTIPAATAAAAPLSPNRRSPDDLRMPWEPPSAPVANDRDGAVRVRSEQRDGPAFEQGQGLGVRMPELVSPSQAGHGESRPHDLQPPGVRSVAVAVVGQPEDRAIPNQVRAPGLPERPFEAVSRRTYLGLRAILRASVRRHRSSFGDAFDPLLARLPE